MKKHLLMLTALIISFSAFATSLRSPDGKQELKFYLDQNGQAFYSLSYAEKKIITFSKMGFILKDRANLREGFEVTEIKYDTVDYQWNPVWGEVKTIRDNHTEMCVSLFQKAQNATMKIRFRLFNDGLGFRYEFDKTSGLDYFQILDECTEFNFTANHKAFWIPGDYDTNEYYYSTTNIKDIDASKSDGNGIGTHGYFDTHSVQTPLMLKSSEGLYINIFEAALVDYPAMHLKADVDNYRFTAALAPNALGTKAYMQTPHNTPWRTVLVSDKATDILASKTILNLNEPSKITHTDFIKPQKFVGIWWGMHVPNKWTWNYADSSNLKLKGTDWNQLIPNGKHGASNENVRAYIDFAAANGIDGVLVEGWNIGWEDWAFRYKEEVFDFVTPYPDFDIKSLNEYAHSKGVKLVMHHETSASVTNYERRIDNAINLMKTHGYEAVKTGYVGFIIPRGEKHDGQWMVNHYIRNVEKFAAAEIMVDAHEPVRPTGLSRTYPNLMACEAARGNEFNAWSSGNPPEHETILPFTRLMGGPMDYTPGIFEIKMNAYDPNSEYQVHTTLAKQLALYVTMYSPFQMAADLIENYEKKMDAFQFIKDVAVDWDDSKYLEAEPGDYLTVARKQKNSDNWFIGAITDENSRISKLHFEFLDSDIWYVATIYGDSKDSHWKNNPMSYSIKKGLVNKKTKLDLQLAAGGGAAISVVKATGEDLKKLKKLK